MYADFWEEWKIHKTGWMQQATWHTEQEGKTRIDEITRLVKLSQAKDIDIEYLAKRCRQIQKQYQKAPHAVI